MKTRKQLATVIVAALVVLLLLSGMVMSSQPPQIETPTTPYRQPTHTPTLSPQLGRVSPLLHDPMHPQIVQQHNRFAIHNRPVCDHAECFIEIQL